MTTQQDTTAAPNAAEPTTESAVISNDRALTRPNGAQAGARSITAAMAERYGMDAKAFEQTLLATCMPKGATRENVAAFLVVAYEHRLNPFTREIFAFEGQGGGIRPIVSVDGWSKLVNSHPKYNGMELTPLKDEEGKLAAVECKIYRKDREHPIVIQEWLSECKRDTQPWRQWPLRMLRHKAMIQGARLAFGFAGIEDEDEYERFVEATHVGSRPLTQTVTLDVSRAVPVPPQDPPGGQTFPASSRT